jgi:hypothetical protein
VRVNKVPFVYRTFCQPKIINVRILILLQVFSACRAGKLELEAVQLSQEAGVRLRAEVHPAGLRQGLDGQVASHRTDGGAAAKGGHRSMQNTRTAVYVIQHDIGLETFYLFESIYFAGLQMSDCGRKSLCVQRYTFQHLLAVAPENLHSCPTIRAFKFPAACVCHIELPDHGYY